MKTFKFLLSICINILICLFRAMKSNYSRFYSILISLILIAAAPSFAKNRTLPKESIPKANGPTICYLYLTEDLMETNANVKARIFEQLDTIKQTFTTHKTSLKKLNNSGFLFALLQRANQFLEEDSQKTPSKKSFLHSKLSSLKDHITYLLHDERLYTQEGKDRIIDDPLPLFTTSSLLNTYSDLSTLDRVILRMELVDQFNRHLETEDPRPGFVFFKVLTDKAEIQKFISDFSDQMTDSYDYIKKGIQTRNFFSIFPPSDQKMTRDLDFENHIQNIKEALKKNPDEKFWSYYGGTTRVPQLVKEAISQFWAGHEDLAHETLCDACLIHTQGPISKWIHGSVNFFRNFIEHFRKNNLTAADLLKTVQNKNNVTANSPYGLFYNDSLFFYDPEAPEGEELILISYARYIPIQPKQ